MRRFLAVALLLVGPSAPGLGATADRAFAVPGKLSALALDGSHVIYAVEPTGAGCRSVWVWDLAHGTRTQVSGRATCVIPRTSTGRGLTEVAISGATMAWIVQTGGNSEQNETLFVHTPTLREAVVARSHRSGDVDGALAGSWLGNLVASASGIFFDSWTTGTTGDVAAASIRRIDGTGRPRLFYAGAEALALRSASPGRLATSDAEGTVHAFHGATVTTLAGVPHLRAIALDGDRLVVLRRAVDMRDPDLLPDGALGASDAPNGIVRGIAAAGGIVVYAIANRVYAQDETTGRIAVVARTSAVLHFVAFDRSALIYGGSQTIHVLPFRVVQAALR